MSPLNRGPLMAPRMPPSNMRALPMGGRFGRAPPPPPPPPGMSGRPGMPPPMAFRPRGRPIPPPPPRSVMMSGMYGPPPPPPGPLGMPMIPGGPIPPPPPPMMRGVPMGPRGPMPMRPGPRGMMPPHALPHIRPRYPPNNNGKAKQGNKKSNKLEDLELKKPWMTDEIRSEIQKKNKLYAKAKKNKDAKEWEEFKDLRNKVTRMIRDAKNEYLAKHPEQVVQKTGDKNTVEKIENATEQTEQSELNGEEKPSSEQAQS